MKGRKGVCGIYMYVAIRLMIGIVSFTTYNRLHDVSDGDRPNKKIKILFIYLVISLLNQYKWRG